MFFSVHHISVMTVLESGVSTFPVDVYANLPLPQEVSTVRILPVAIIACRRNDGRA